MEFFWNFKKTSSNSKNSKKNPKKFQSFYQKLDEIPKIPKIPNISSTHVIWRRSSDVRDLTRVMKSSKTYKNSSLFWIFFGILPKSSSFYVYFSILYIICVKTRAFWQISNEILPKGSSFYTKITKNDTSEPHGGYPMIDQKLKKLTGGLKRKW